MKHTYHPNTFGLLYGKTTKTACAKRVRTELIVPRMQTDCPDCQDVVIADMLAQQRMFLAYYELKHSGIV